MDTSKSRKEMDQEVRTQDERIEPSRGGKWIPAVTHGVGRPNCAGAGEIPQETTTPNLAQRSTSTRPYHTRPAQLIWQMTLVFDALIYAIAWTHVLLAPYTKVEESFTLHALHDLLLYGGSPDALQKVKSNNIVLKRLLIRWTYPFSVRP